ncbi:MAG: tetratricopeptide repeat protein [Anaerolineae bacterium]|jgi:tetratricopeptide (TPR) repeat protein
MKKLWIFVPVLLLAALALAGCGTSAEKLNAEGNEAFAEQNYEEALAAYTQAQEDAPELAEPHYNAANAYYREADYGQSQQQIEQALVGEDSQASLDQHSYYNLGNTFFEAQKYEAAIEAYQEALRLDPEDVAAKQNLELALRQLQDQQQEQNQQQEQDEQQDQQQQDQQQEQDEQQDQQQQDQQQEQGEQQDQQQQDEQQDRQEQDQNEPQDGEDRQQADEQQEPQQDGQPDPQGQADEQQGGGQPQAITGLSEEQARQLFEAAAQETQSLEEALQQIMVFPAPPPAEDW